MANKSKHEHPDPLVVEISVRKFRADDAIVEIERGVDDALHQGAESIRIVHGKGTGVLRTIVAEILDEHPAIDSYAMAPWNEGGTGVTIATFII